MIWKPSQLPSKRRGFQRFDGRYVLGEVAAAEAVEQAVLAPPAAAPPLEKLWDRRTPFPEGLIDQRRWVGKLITPAIRPAAGC